MGKRPSSVHWLPSVSSHLILVGNPNDVNTPVAVASLQPYVASKVAGSPRCLNIPARTRRDSTSNNGRQEYWPFQKNWRLGSWFFRESAIGVKLGSVPEFEVQNVAPLQTHRILGLSIANTIAIVVQPEAV